MSFSRIIRPLLVLSFIVTYLCFVTYDKWIPYTCEKLQEIKGGGSLTQYIYTKKDENNHPEQAVIVSRFFNGEMYISVSVEGRYEMFRWLFCFSGAGDQLLTIENF